MNARMTYLIGPACIMAVLGLLLASQKPERTCVSIKYKTLESSAVFDTPDEALKYIVRKSSENTINSIQMGPCRQ